MEQTDLVELNMERAVQECRDELSYGNNKFAVHRLSTYLFECQKFLMDDSSPRLAKEFYDEHIRDVQTSAVSMLSAPEERPSENQVEMLANSIEEARDEYTSIQQISDWSPRR